MDLSSKAESIFKDITSRELSGSKVRKRPCIGSEPLGFDQIGAVAVEHHGDGSPPMALSFCKTSRNSHILAVAVEGGYVSLFNTRRKFNSSSTYQQNAEDAKVSDWVAHHNAIFDICWIKEDTNILTASGDQSIKVWDTQEEKCLKALVGHTGSVKSVCSHPTNHDLILSGSRDGSFALWDLRCSTSGRDNLCINSISAVEEAHTQSSGKRARPGKDAPKSVTSVLYLKDEVSIASAGAVDSIVKFWDTRNLKVPIIQACPRQESSLKGKRLHGISSLSQDSSGVFISASCMDNRIYLYNVFQLEKGPVRSFSGCRIGTFFVKSSISPDGVHVLSGSSDGNGYIWQVDKPQADPIVLEGHDGEVSAVDWIPSEIGKVATTSDDFTVRLWNIQTSSYSNTRSPSFVRRRVMALPTVNRRKLFMAEGSENCPSEEEFHENNSSNSPIMVPEIGTPESHKKTLFGLEEKKTPDSTFESPNSVLNPPSSLKRRTIRDYFTAAS